MSYFKADRLDERRPRSAISAASPALNANAAPMLWVFILLATGAQELDPAPCWSSRHGSEGSLRRRTSPAGTAQSSGHLEQRDEVGRGENRRRLRASALQLLKPRRRVGEEIPPQRLRRGVKNIEQRLPPGDVRRRPRRRLRLPWRRPHTPPCRNGAAAAGPGRRRRITSLSLTSGCRRSRRSTPTKHASDRIGQIVVGVRGHGRSRSRPERAVRRSSPQSWADRRGGSEQFWSATGVG